MIIAFACATLANGISSLIVYLTKNKLKMGWTCQLMSIPKHGIQSHIVQNIEWIANGDCKLLNKFLRSRLAIVDECT